MAVSSATDQRASRRALAPAASRPHREDLKLPAHLDKLFSAWKVLVGPDDWQDYVLRKEGAVRYRLHNLPEADSFHPGVYELALHYDRDTHAHGTRESISNSLRSGRGLVPVYVGQAENVRTRLQEYGRCGSHLEGPLDVLQNGKCQQCEAILFKKSQANFGLPDADSFNSFEAVCSLPHLFTNSFCQGYSIAFRWTATKSKFNAAALEAFLLKHYDYAWNRGSNGERRPEDAFRKLQHSTKPRTWYNLPKQMLKLSKMDRKVRNLREKRIAITAIQESLWSIDNPATRFSGAAGDPFEFLSIFWKRQEKEERSLPSSQLNCSKEHDSHLELGSSVTRVCGVIDDSGMVCNEVPVPGRKRCKAHKGMRLRVKVATEGSILAVKYVVMEPFELAVCGIIDGSGIVCKDTPLPGRKRCKAHKGMRMHFRSRNDPDKEAACNATKCDQHVRE